MSQLLVLTRNEFAPMQIRITQERMDVMLRQILRGDVNIVRENDVVRMRHSKVNALALEAIDVMLQIADRHPVDFTHGDDIRVLLRFVAQQTYTILHLTPETLASVQIIKPKKGECILLLSESLKPEDCPNLPERQFLAQKGEDGVYHFYH